MCNSINQESEAIIMMLIIILFVAFVIGINYLAYRDNEKTLDRLYPSTKGKI